MWRKGVNEMELMTAFLDLTTAEAEAVWAPLLDPLRARLQDLGPRVAEGVAQVAKDRRELAVLFPQLPRTMSKAQLGGGIANVAGSRCDLDGWRKCDAAAALLLAESKAVDAELLDLYAHGDLEERAMLLRSLAALPITPATGALLLEVQRTNMVLHLEAACCDSDLLVRVRKAGLPNFGKAETNRLLLKVAFLDLPLSRVFDGSSLANEELSRMLQDLATEREAAGRPVWRDTDRLLAKAPVPGTIARILGGIEHGDDQRRLAAAEALALLHRKDLAALAAERLPREPRPEIRAALERAAATTNATN
jgi:hypothetical protein